MQPCSVALFIRSESDLRAWIMEPECCKCHVPQYITTYVSVQYDNNSASFFPETAIYALYMHMYRGIPEEF